MLCVSGRRPGLGEKHEFVVAHEYFARWRMVTCLVGIALVAVGGGLFGGTQLAAAGGAVIIISVLPLPWGSERYQRACAKAIAQAAHAIRVTEEQRRRAAVRRADQFRDVAVPDELICQHDQLMKLLEADEQLWRDHARPTVERVLRRSEISNQVRAIQARGAASAIVSAEDYSAKLRVLLTSRERDSEERARENGRILSELVARQEDLTPPDALTEVHELMCRAFRGQLATMWGLYTALQGSDVDAIRTAATHYEDAVGLCEMRVRALGMRPRGRALARTQE